MELNLHPKFLEAAQYVVNNQVASISMIQRVFCLGYNSGCQLIEQLEVTGLISSPHNGERTVLVKDLSSISDLVRSLQVDSMVKKIEEINKKYQR